MPTEVGLRKVWSFVTTKLHSGEPGLGVPAKEQPGREELPSLLFHWHQLFPKSWFGTKALGISPADVLVPGRPSPKVSPGSFA